MMLAVVLSLVVLVQQTFAAQCRLSPIQQQICEHPVGKTFLKSIAIIGKVTKVEEVLEHGSYPIGPFTPPPFVTTRIYDIRVVEVFRKASGDIEAGDVVTLVAPRQQMSDRIYMVEGRKYFIRGDLKDEAGEKEIMSSFCGTVGMPKGKDLEYIRGNFRCDAKMSLYENYI